MRAVRLRAALWPVALCSTFVALAFFGTMLTSRAFVFLIGGALLGVCLVLRALYNPDAKAEEIEVRADEGGLEFGRHRVNAKAIRRARVMPLEAGAWVEIVRAFPRPPLRLQFESTADARDVVAALGFDASRVRDRFRIVSPITRSPVLSFLLSVGIQLGAQIGGARWMLLGVAVVIVGFLDERKRYVEIGPDGLFVRTMFSRIHLPTAALRGVRRSREARHSRELIFTSADASTHAWIYENQVAWIEHRVQELIAARDGTRHSSDDARALVGRTASELRAIGSRPETFRAEGLDRTALLRIVENVSAAPALRARAAVALPDEPELRARIQTIAANSTLPELRVALERSSLDETAVDEALADLDRAVTRYK